MNKYAYLPLVASVIAFSTGTGQSLPPIRPIGQTVARSTEQLSSIASAVALPDGRVLINDILMRRVLLLDSSLTALRVVADSTASTANAYGARPGGLIAFRGDSTLFVDPASMSMLVISPGGSITRVISAPRPQDISFLVGGPNGYPAFDPLQRLVYRTAPQPRSRERGTANVPATAERLDSVAVVRYDLTTRALDTAGFHKITRLNPNALNPIPTVDDWAILSDGTIAFISGNDFSITWVALNGTRRPTGKVPFEWQRLTQDDKTALVDSAQSALTAVLEKARQAAASGTPMVVTVGGEEIIVRAGRGAGGFSAPPARSASSRPTALGSELSPVNMVGADQLPDYRPAFTAGSARGGPDGQLWVRTTSPVGTAGPIYFVINSNGEVSDRIQLPLGRIVVGFSRNGEVYMAVRDIEGKAYLERARLK